MGRRQDRAKLTMRRPPPARVLLSTYQTAARNVGERSGLAVAQRDVEVLTPARLLPGEQRRHDAVAGVQARRQVRDGDADLDGRPVPRARNVHQAELGLNHNVIAGPVGVGTRLSVPRDAGIDERRIDLGGRGVVQFVLFERAGEVVLDQDVALCHELVQDLHASWVLEA